MTLEEYSGLIEKAFGIKDWNYSKKTGPIIFFVGLTLPRYKFSVPSASLDMNLRQYGG